MAIFKKSSKSSRYGKPGKYGKSGYKIIVLIVLFLLALQLVYAIGIRPAKTNILSDDLNKKNGGSIWVVNNDLREFEVDIYVEGEMAEYVALKHKKLKFREDDDALEIEFTVNLPEEVPPGISTANIVIEESLAGPSGTISSRIVLKHKINIQGPYPDQYVEASLNFHDQGDKIRFVSEVKNLGQLDLKDVQAKFYVNDKKKEQQVLETKSTPLAKQEGKLLEAAIDRDLFERGEFEVSSIITYDDQKLELVKNLIVGNPEIEVTYFDPYFVANKVNQYSLDLLNKWNKEIENVFVDVEVQKDGQKIDEFRTKSINIEGLVMKRINDFFDARSKQTGKYTFNMVVNFWNNYRMEAKTFQGELLTAEEFEQIELAPPLIGQAAGAGLWGQSLIWMIVGVTAGILGVLLLLRIRKRRIVRDRVEGDNFGRNDSGGNNSGGRGL